jgi:hypothetical protein
MACHKYVRMLRNWVWKLAVFHTSTFHFPFSIFHFPIEKSIADCLENFHSTCWKFTMTTHPSCVRDALHACSNERPQRQSWTSRELQSRATMMLSTLNRIALNAHKPDSYLFLVDEENEITMLFNDSNTLVSNGLYNRVLVLILNHFSSIWSIWSIWSRCSIIGSEASIMYGRYILWTAAIFCYNTWAMSGTRCESCSFWRRKYSESMQNSQLLAHQRTVRVIRKIRQT